jgi:hypothetical protein
MRWARTRGPGSLALIAVLATATIGCGERVFERWETVADARQNGVFRRGWVPDILPDSATALVALYDPDTSARCASARFAATDREAIRKAANASGFVPFEGPRSGPPFRECPFLAGDISTAEEVLRRGIGEFLIVTADGSMHFWSD